jgi:hypothetical protein
MFGLPVADPSADPWPCNVYAVAAAAQRLAGMRQQW